MFSKGKFKDISIPVILEESLTSDSCGKIITELIKYILYQKQQIPFSCDSLVQLQTRFKPNDRNNSSTKTLLASLDNICQQLTSQLQLSGCSVKEVIVIIGATTISPKFCLKIEIPEKILNSRRHLEYQHSYRKPLLILMRSVLECQEFQDFMSIPQAPTNTFVLLRKSDKNEKSDFFLPKPQYSPNFQLSSFTIKFSQKNDTIEHCQCGNLVRPYDDNNSDNSDELIEIKSENNAPCIWYQSKEILKGFKYQR